MLKKGVLLLVIILILLPGIIASIEEIEKLKQRIAFHAEDYEAKNTGYLKTLTEIKDAENKLNVILGASESGTLNQEELTKALGESKKTNWAINERTGSEIEFQEELSKWEIPLYDSDELNVKAKINPIITNINGEEKISHKLDISINLPESQPDLNSETLNSEISEIQTLAKEYNLNPEDSQVANNLANAASNLQKLYEEYAKNSNEECTDFFSRVLGQEYKISEQKIVTKEFTISRDKDVTTTVKMIYCEKCIGLDTKNWLNIEFEFKNDQGKAIDYLLLQEPLPSLYQEYEENSFKQEIINSMNNLLTAIGSGSYRVANNFAVEMQIMNKVWDIKANENKDQAAENFIKRVEFWESMFDSYPLKTEFSNQVEFQKDLMIEIEEGKDEICNNKFDDNEDGKVDCEDSLCKGQLCSKKSITENNETKVIDLYCMEGVCQEKNEILETPKNIICGNQICEEGEIETCISDCTSCQKREPIECKGKVIFKGEDKKGCPLEPVCIERSEVCSTDNDCEQPSCGTTKCVQGQCQVTDLKQCGTTKCVDGQERIQICQTEEKIKVEICLNKEWVETGQKCSNPSNKPIDILEKKGTACEKQEDCSSGICSNGLCKDVAQNKKIEQKEIEQEAEYSGTSFTGKVVVITGEGIGITGTQITGITRDTIKNPDVLKEAKDYDIERKVGSGSSPLTGSLNPVQSEKQRLAEIEEKVQINSKTSITLTETQKDIFVVKGICTETQNKKESSLLFEGAGEDFTKINTLTRRYDIENTGYCNWMLENAIKERQRIESDLNEEYAKWFLESVAYDVEEYETKKQQMEEIIDEVIKNQEEIAKMMDCSDIEKLSNHNPINFEYKNQYGTFQYNENKKQIKLESMKREVEVLSPKLGVVISPTSDFIKSDLKLAMQAHKFIGSSKSIAQREVNNGLTNYERTTLENNKELVEKIYVISDKQPDGKLDFLLTIKQGEEVIYNLYGIMDKGSLLKLQPMTLDQAPAVDIKIIAGFDEILDIIKESEGDSLIFEKRPSWDSGSGSPLRAIKSVINGIKMKTKISKMMGSVELNPKNPEVKEIFDDLFYLIAEEEKFTQESQTKETKEFWTQSGEKISII